MTIYALAESRAVMRFYEALETGKISRIYEAYQEYRQTIEIAREESKKQERKIEEEYRKVIKCG